MSRLLLTLIVAIPLAIAADQKKDGRVRAKEPTVVTVEGQAEQVKEDRRFDQRVGGAVKNGAAKTWNAIVGFGGWLLNTGDDIPSKRERRERKAEERDSRQQR